MHVKNSFFLINTNCNYMNTSSSKTVNTDSPESKVSNETLLNTNKDNFYPMDEEEKIKEALWFNNMCNGLNSITPDLAYEYAPKSFSLQTETTYDFINDNELAFESLPRTVDGKIDVEKIKTSLEKSISLITSQNDEAQKMMDYGIYKDAINNTNLLVAMLGPEIANVVTAASGDQIPEWATTGASLLDLDLNTILKIIKEAGLNLEEYGIDNVVDLLDVKKSSEIEANIEAQEKDLADLLDFKIENDEDAKEFLNKYSELTKTSFFCDKIDECFKLYNNIDSSEKDKLKAYQKACGSSKNLTDAQKNNIMTNVCYDVGFKYLIPVIINKVDSIPTKIISTAMPTYIELAETATKDKKEDEIANLRNLDYETMVDILAEGAVDGLFVNINKNINYGKGVLKKIKGKALKTTIATGLTYASKFFVKSATPNYSSWGKCALTCLAPGSGAFFDW